MATACTAFVTSQQTGRALAPRQQLWTTPNLPSSTQCKPAASSGPFILSGLAACVGLAQGSRVKLRSISRSATRGPRLYGNPGSRSPLVNWYLFEIGQDFDFVDASQDRGPHPFGQIPCLVDDDMVVFESGAILMYLADKYGGLTTPVQRAEAGKWVVWANATLDPICFKEIDGRVVGTGLDGEPRQIGRLDELLEGQDFILGEDFSVADVAIGSYLLYVLLFFPNTDVTKWPNVRRYMKSLCEREAYARALGPKTAQMLSEALAKEPAQGMFGGLF
mmetsp:Transcript_22951/g.52608  ORF Transcript_22951/g.52608 Transcript_22951/m.52608 type:complete len:277 (+) Transcript_22951:55-885(+)